MGFRKIGSQFDRSPARLHCFVEPARNPERVAQIIVGLRITGSELDRPTVSGHGFIQPSPRAQSGAQIEVRFRKAGLAFDGPTIRRDRIIELTAVRQRRAQIQMGLRKIRSQFKSAPESGHSFMQRTPFPQYGAQIKPNLHKVRLELKRAPVSGDCFIEPAQILDDITQIEVRLGNARLRRQDLPVKRFSLRQPASLAPLPRNLEGLWNRHKIKARLQPSLPLIYPEREQNLTRRLRPRGERSTKSGIGIHRSKRDSLSTACAWQERVFGTNPPVGRRHAVALKSRSGGTGAQPRKIWEVVTPWRRGALARSGAIQQPCHVKDPKTKRDFQCGEDTAAHSRSVIFSAVMTRQPTWAESPAAQSTGV